MYAVIKTGGKQYRVEQGTTQAFERLDGDPGQQVTFGEVLLVGGDTFKIGQPLVQGASVTGTIVEQGRAKKVVIFKFRRRKNYKRKKGHRQYFTRVRIDAIAAGSVDVAAARPPRSRRTTNPRRAPGARTPAARAARD